MTASSCQVLEPSNLLKIPEKSAQPVCKTPSPTCEPNAGLPIFPKISPKTTPSTSGILKRKFDAVLQDRQKSASEDLVLHHRAVSPSGSCLSTYSTLSPASSSVNEKCLNKIWKFFSNSGFVIVFFVNKTLNFHNLKFHLLCVIIDILYQFYKTRIVFICHYFFIICWNTL